MNAEVNIYKPTGVDKVEELISQFAFLGEQLITEDAESLSLIMHQCEDIQIEVGAVLSNFRGSFLSTGDINKEINEIESLNLGLFEKIKGFGKNELVNDSDNTNNIASNAKEISQKMASLLDVIHHSSLEVAKDVLIMLTKLEDLSKMISRSKSIEYLDKLNDYFETTETMLINLARSENMKNVGSKLRHDLSGVLNAPLGIIGLIDSMLQSNLKYDDSNVFQERKDYLFEMLVKSIERIRELMIVFLNEICTASIEYLQAPMVKITTRELFSDLCLLVTPTMDGVEIEIDEEMEDSLTEVIRGDLLNILVNSVRNAPKHGEANKVILSSKVDREKGFITICIMDNGKGILEEKVANLASMGIEGFSTCSTGFGLRDLDKRLIGHEFQRHGGLQNTSGTRGARIDLQIPLAEA